MDALFVSSYLGLSLGILGNDRFFLPKISLRGGEVEFYDRLKKKLA